MSVAAPDAVCSRSDRASWMKNSGTAIATVRRTISRNLKPGERHLGVACAEPSCALHSPRLDRAQARGRTWRDRGAGKEVWRSVRGDRVVALVQRAPAGEPLLLGLGHAVEASRDLLEQRAIADGDRAALGLDPALGLH